MASRTNNRQLDLFEGPPATPREIEFTRAIVNAQTMDDALFAVAYGRSPKGILPKIIGADGQTVIRCRDLDFFYKGVALVGFIIKRPGAQPIRVIYSDSVALAAGSAAEYRSILQAGNLQIAQRMRRAAEELLASAFTGIDADRWRAACDAIGIDPVLSRPKWRARHRLAHALIDQMIDNAIPPERLGALALIRMMPPSRRQNHAHLLSTASDTDLERDTIHHSPILILFPKWVSKYFAGNRARDIMDELNLPRAASNILMQAVGPIIHILGMQRPQQDAAPADLAWLTPNLARAIGQHAPRMFCQRIVMNLACLTFAATRNAQLAETVGIWACLITEKLKRESELNFEAATKISNWIVAPAAQRDAAGVPHWHDKISLPNAIAAASNYEVYKTRAEAPDAKIDFPAWALPDGSIPGTSYRLIRIDSLAMLTAEANRMNNCAAIYGDEALRGGCAIYIARRPARPQDKPSSVHHCDRIGDPAVTGAMLMLRRNGHGQPYVAQLYAAENRSPRQEIRDGIEALLG